MRFKGTELLLVILSFLAIYIIWGSTYLAVRIAIFEIPPFFMAGTRFLLAGTILASVLACIKAELPSRKQLLNSAIIGTIMLGIGTSGVAWALQYVDSGITALIISGQPLLMVFMVWIFLNQRPVLSSYIGVALGMFGMSLLVDQDSIIGQSSSIWGALAIFTSMLAWGFGSVLVRLTEVPKSQGYNAATQMIVAGLLVLLFSYFADDFSTFQWQNISTQSWLAFLYLVFFGSIIAFSSFVYLLERISPEKVATSTYVNPIVALILGWSILDEVITQQSILAAAIMLTGVLFINIDLLAYFRRKFT